MGSRGEPHHVRDSRKRGNTPAQGCEYWEPGVQAATRVRQRGREKVKVMIGVPFHTVLDLATGTHNMEINGR